MLPKLELDQVTERRSSRWRWQYIGREVWRPGKNVPALGRGGGPDSARRTLNAAGMQMVGNAIVNLEQFPKDFLVQMHARLCDIGTQAVGRQNVDATHVFAKAAL